MHNLRHFYYQNKEKIWKAVLIIAFILGIVYFINYYLQNNNNNKNTVGTLNQNVNYSDEQNKTYITNQSQMSGQTVTENEVQKINNTISAFLGYCKNQDFENAYNMISEDCKETLYETLEKFKQKYIGAKFNKDSVYEIERWLGNTYKISISKDLLTTGDVNNNSKQIEYITIVEENSQQKLNVNNYIGKSNINKIGTKDNVKITAISKKTYMDYEIYDFVIENLSGKTIKLDTLDKIGTMYLVDSNGNKYNAYTNEILSTDLEILSNHKFNISIKYSNTYLTRQNISQIVFENIILDYAEYRGTQNPEQFNGVTKITIDL